MVFISFLYLLLQIEVLGVQNKKTLSILCVYLIIHFNYKKGLLSFNIDSIRSYENRNIKNT